MHLDHLTDLFQSDAVGEVPDENGRIRPRSRRKRRENDTLRLKIRFCLLDDMRLCQCKLHSCIIRFSVENVRLGDVQTVCNRQGNGVTLEYVRCILDYGTWMAMQVRRTFTVCSN